MRFIQLFCKDARGVASIEMAFALPVFTVFLLGTIGMSHAFWVRNSMEFAQDTASRFIMMNPNATEQEIEEVISTNMFGVDTDEVEISVSSSAISGVTYRTVDIVYDYDFLTAFSFMPSELTSRSMVPAIP